MVDDQAQEARTTPESVEDFLRITKHRRTHIFNRLAATKPLSEFVDLLGYEAEEENDEAVEAEHGRGQIRTSTALAHTGFAIRLGVKAENSTHVALVDCAVEWTWDGPVDYTLEALTAFVAHEASPDTMTTAKTLLTETASGIRVVLDGVFAIPQSDLTALIVAQLSEQHGLTAKPA